MALLHCVEDETDSGSQQQVHGLVQQFWGKDAPYEKMVPQNSDQHNVGCSRDGPEQGQTVTAVADSDRTPAERTTNLRCEGTVELCFLHV